MNARDWFNKAQSEGWAIGAFNVDNFDIMQAICMAGAKMSSPVMLEFSAGEIGYFGLENIKDLALNAQKEYKIPILLNLDHSHKVEDCIAAVEIGFDDVHFDGSALALSENVEGAVKVVAAAHAKNTLVEGEIDKLPGESEVHGEDLDPEVIKKAYTDPKKAAKFVEDTGVDIFAACFGNLHGTFPSENIDFDLLGTIRAVLPKTFLSMHGGSGIAADQVKKAIKIGAVVKVNVNTEIRTEYADALGEKLAENPGEIVSYKLSPDIIESVAAVVEGKIEVFGSRDKV